jgi:hypothetical protein
MVNKIECQWLTGDQVVEVQCVGASPRCCQGILLWAENVGWGNRNQLLCNIQEAAPHNTERWILVDSTYFCANLVQVWSQPPWT